MYTSKYKKALQHTMFRVYRKSARSMGLSFVLISDGQHCARSFTLSLSLSIPSPMRADTGIMSWNATSPKPLSLLRKSLLSRNASCEGSSISILFNTESNFPEINKTKLNLEKEDYMPD